MEVVVEAIHNGLTKNNNYYSRSELEKVTNTWIHPYNKPVLAHHNMYSEPLGRVIDANFKRSKLKQGAYCAELVLDLSDKDAQAKVEDGRYSTVSVGTTVTSAVCSICGNDWAKSYCEHRKGRVYEGKLCYWRLSLSEHNEVSFVNAPADEYAQVIVVYPNKRPDSGSEASAEGVYTIDERRTEIQMDSGLKQKEHTDVEDIVNAFEDTSQEQQDDTDAPVVDEQIADEPTPDWQPALEVMKKELNTTIAALQQQLEDVTGKYAELLNSYNSVIEQNTELARLIHVELLEHYCDVAVTAGLYENKEKAREAAAKKKAIELRRELVSILDRPQKRVIQTVDCPGGGGEIQTERVQDTSPEDKKTYTIKDLEEMLSQLLSK